MKSLESKKFTIVATVTAIALGGTACSNPELAPKPEIACEYDTQPGDTLGGFAFDALSIRGDTDVFEEAAKVSRQSGIADINNIDPRQNFFLTAEQCAAAEKNGVEVSYLEP